MCEEDGHEKREKKKKKEKEKEKEKRREGKRKQKLIHTDKQTERQIDRRTDRHKSFIDMRSNTEQYSKSNRIILNRIEWRTNQQKRSNKRI